jgi:uncharacterized integral membrane protein (TIGR00698 family)
VDQHINLLSQENPVLRNEKSSATNKLKSILRRLISVFPGVFLCGLIALVSLAFEMVEQFALARPYIEAVVVAILLGMAIRTFWIPAGRWQTGIGFSAKQLLEIAVMLLGASFKFSAIAASGFLLLGAIAVTVIVTLMFSFGTGRLLGLSPRLSILIACGNSICGNTAIATVAPVIGANSDEIASSISFTAILGVMMVLGLPFLIPLLQLSATQYGILAGLTVYAIPQVLAATIPAGLVSTQIGTLVKLMRVLMLGPIVLSLSLLASRLQHGVRIEQKKNAASVFRFVPWFIVGFLVLATLRSFQIVPGWLVGPLTNVTAFLTVVSMAALGLGVDIRVLASVGGRITAAVMLSLLLLLSISIGLIYLF